MSLDPRFAPRTAALATALVLAACGGGGSDAPAASAAAGVGSAASTSTSSTAPTTPVAVTSTGSTCGVPDFAATALLRVNQLRAAGADCRSAGRFAAAGALTWSPLLTQSAEAHSQDMVARNFFSHTGSNGSTLALRVDATGYAWSNLGENIAAGYAGLEAVLAGWMASDGHCANLMNPAFDQIGLVCVPGNANTSYNNYWTMDLARAR